MKRYSISINETKHEGLFANDCQVWLIILGLITNGPSKSHLLAANGF